MTGCTTDELADMNEQSGGPGINFGVTATSTDRLSRGGLTSTYQSLTLKSAETADTLAVTVETADYFIEEKQISRGTPIDGAENLDNFKVYAYYYASESTTTPSLFFEENVSKRDADTWATGTTYYWPTSGELAFFGMSPAVNNDFLWFDRYQAPAGENDAVISYIAPTEPEQQPDIVVASTGRMNNSESGEKVPMAFKHILSQVKFRVGTEMQAGTINSITLTNVVKHGYYHHAANGGAWSLDEAGEDQTCNYTVDLDEAVTEGSTGTDLGVTEQTLMMLPQTLGANCELVVEFVGSDGETRTLRASLAGGEWTMGGTTVYNINIEPDFEFKLSENRILDAHYEIYLTNLDVTNVPAGKEWTVSASTANNDVTIQAQNDMNSWAKQGYWTHQYVDNKDNSTGSARGSNSFSGVGSGSFPIAIFVPENSGNDLRTIALDVKLNGSDDVVQTINIQQYAPSWFGDNIGCERIEGEDSPWGFFWTSDYAIVYDLKQCNVSDRESIRRYIQWTKTLRSLSNIPLLGDIIKWLFGSNIPDLGFVDMKTSTSGSGWDRVTIADEITINIGSLVASGIAESDDNGQQNTIDLYNYNGFQLVNDIIARIENIAGYQRTEVGKGVNPANSAAIACMKLNSWNVATVEDNQILKLVSSTPVWYLPARNEVQGIKDEIKALKEYYWTSTSVQNSSQKAYKFDENGNVTEGERDHVLHVRAVRKRN